MDTSGHYRIDLRDLKDGEISRFWELNDDFFSALDEQEIKHGKLSATLRVKKKAAGYQLDLHATGTVEIPCDRCLEPMLQPIEAEDSIEVRFGNAYDDDGERITVPEERPVLDISWNLYETIALAIPLFHAHPNGECPAEVSQYITSDDEPNRGDGEGDSIEEPSDSRWDALKALLGE